MDLSLQTHERRLVLDGLNTQKTVLERNITNWKAHGVTDENLKIHVDRLARVEEDIKLYSKSATELPQPFYGADYGSESKHERPLVYYGDYLMLDRILNSQVPLSEAIGGKMAHDEMLFIIIHQTYELWFKQILHELGAAMRIMDSQFVSSSDLGKAIHHLQRVIEIQRILVSQITVLETMTPINFMDFRDYLFPASGFQSYQFRLVENKLGLDPTRRIMHERKAYHVRLSEPHQQIVQHSESEPTLLKAVEKWLERFPFFKSDDFDFLMEYKNSVQSMFSVAKEILLRDARGSSKQQNGAEDATTIGEEGMQSELKSLGDNDERLKAIFDEEFHNEQMKEGKRSLSFKATQAAMLIMAYSDEPLLYLPSTLLSCLVEIDENIALWRYRHALMTQRMIGSKIGTGGSSGYWYLKATLEKGKVFADIANLATFMLPRKLLPNLPKSVKATLGFYHEVLSEKKDEKKE